MTVRQKRITFKDGGLYCRADTGDAYYIRRQLACLTIMDILQLNGTQNSFHMFITIDRDSTINTLVDESLSLSLSLVLTNQKYMQIGSED